MWIKKESPRVLACPLWTRSYSRGIWSPVWVEIGSRAYLNRPQRRLTSGRRVRLARRRRTILGDLAAHVLAAGLTGRARPLAPQGGGAKVEGADVVVCARLVVENRRLTEARRALLRGAGEVVGLTRRAVRERRVRDAGLRIARIRRTGIAVVDDRRGAFVAHTAGRRTGLHAVADVAVRTVLRRAPRTGASLTRVAFRTGVSVVAGLTVHDRRRVVTRVARETEVPRARIAVVALLGNLALLDEAAELDGDPTGPLAAARRVFVHADALDLAAHHGLFQSRGAHGVGLFRRLTRAIDALQRDLVGGQVGAARALPGGALVVGHDRLGADRAGGRGIAAAGDGEQGHERQHGAVLHHLALHRVLSSKRESTLASRLTRIPVVHWPHCGTRRAPLPVR